MGPSSTEAPYSMLLFESGKTSTKTHVVCMNVCVHVYHQSVSVMYFASKKHITVLHSGRLGAIQPIQAALFIQNQILTHYPNACTCKNKLTLFISVKL